METNSIIKSKIKKLKLLIVIFNFKLQKREIPAFRGAICEKVGLENVLFHNHMDSKFIYRYPQIQYKVLNQNPCIMCMNHGTEEILKLFQRPDIDININGKQFDLEIKEILIDKFECEILDDLQEYRIFNWFALNEKNFKKYINSNDYDRTNLLQKILIGNILSFAKGINWTVSDQIDVRILQLPNHRSFSFKDQKMIGFNINFLANVSLPNYIGLGKSVSRGFGMIQRI